MDPNPTRASNEEFEQALENTEQDYVLCLYVAGTTSKSVRAIENIKRICDGEMAGHYDLEVIDVYQNPSAATEDQIVAVPTLVKRLPAPLRKVIGDLSDEGYVLRGLAVKPKSST